MRKLEVYIMATVRRREGESLESMLHRFKRVVNDAGIMSEVKKREYYKSKSVKKREKRAAAQQKRLKQERAMRRRMSKMD